MYLPSSLDRQHAVNSCKVDTFCMILNTALASLNTRIRLILFLFTRRCNVHDPKSYNWGTTKICKLVPRACHFNSQHFSRGCHVINLTQVKVHCTCTQQPAITVSIFCVILLFPLQTNSSFESHWILRAVCSFMDKYKFQNSRPNVFTGG